MSELYIPSGNVEGWINEAFHRLAEIVEDYDYSLELRWIPPEHRTREDKKPYVIWDTRTNSPVLYAGADESPINILARLFEGDNTKHNVLDKLEAENTAREAFKQKEWLDRLGEAHDEAEFLIRSPLHYVTMNGKKFDHERRRIQ